MDRIRDKLRDSNYRITGQRSAILKVMVENREKHLSAEEVLNEARKMVPNIGIATVYRTLEKLANIEILYKTKFDGSCYRYELSDEGIHQHHHIICLGCGRIVEMEDNFLNSLEKQLENHGYQVIDHELKIYAYCPTCNGQK
ncbi:MAG: Fur family transcriptional regulator [Syntrophomonadaceae bacterium]|jgi:Fur family ferric uptake transcriptional regulator